MTFKKMAKKIKKNCGKNVQYARDRHAEYAYAKFT